MALKRHGTYITALENLSHTTSIIGFWFVCHRKRLRMHLKRAHLRDSCHWTWNHHRNNRDVFQVPNQFAEPVFKPPFLSCSRFTFKPKRLPASEIPLSWILVRIKAHYLEDRKRKSPRNCHPCFKRITQRNVTLFIIFHVDSPMLLFSQQFFCSIHLHLAAFICDPRWGRMGFRLKVSESQ